MLARRDFEGLFEWTGAVRSPQRVLYSLTHDSDELIAWRAVEAIGKLAGIRAADSLEKVRDSVRRLFWLMNDESGGLGRRSPDMIGEILVNVPLLIAEFGIILPSFFNEEPFERGSHLAVSRIAAVKPETYDGSIEELGKSLDSRDEVIRCYAARALLEIGTGKYGSAIRKLANESTPVVLYDFDKGLLVKTDVGQVVKTAIDQAEESGRAA
jgi:hypothetical protein